MASPGWASAISDAAPDVGLARLTTGQPNNIGKFSDPAYDAAIEGLRKARTDDEVKAATVSLTTDYLRPAPLGETRFTFGLPDLAEGVSLVASAIPWKRGMAVVVAAGPEHAARQTTTATRAEREIMEDSKCVGEAND